MGTYDVGDVVPLSVVVRDGAGAPADATAVVLTVTLPDGTTTTPTVAHPSTGSYTATYAATTARLHGVSWTATGTNASAYRDSFTVTESVTPLLALDDIKARLNTTQDTNDEELRRFQSAAAARIAMETGRVLAPRLTVQTVDMTGSDRAVLTIPQPCLLSVSAVTDGGVALASDEWELDPSGQLLTRRNATWTGEVQISGLAGVAGDDLVVAQQATLELLAHLWETQRTPAGRNALAGPVPGMGYALPNRVAEMVAPLVIPGGFA